MKKEIKPIEVMMENNNKLMETINGNAMKAMEIFKMEDNWSKKGKEIFDSYMKEQKAILEKSMQPATFEKGIESVTTHMTKAVETQIQFATKTMDFYREAFTSAVEGKQESPFNRMMELFNDNMHAMMDVTRKNMEAFRNVNWN